MIREDIIDQATKKLADVKASLKKEFGKNKKKINEEYKKHFMVVYDDMMKENTSGINWLQTIKKRLHYENETVFLNLPNLQDPSKIENSIISHDLFIVSGFI